jgi:hypothetical protein
MARSLSLPTAVLLTVCFASPSILADKPRTEPVEAGTLPTDARGRMLNLDFETGTLADWTAEGDAFRGQPIEGDTVHRRRGDMQSRHAGRFWVGTYFYSRRNLTPRCLARHVLACDFRATSLRRTW